MTTTTLTHVEQTIADMVKGHPSLFNCRWAVLRFLFFVLGNGYEWYNGQLVEHIGSHARSVDHITEPANVPVYAADTDGFASDNKLYPYKSLSALATIPDDIQPDWLEAAREAIALAIKYCPIDFHGHDCSADLRERSQQLKERFS